jgi:hypothetical protein
LPRQGVVQPERLQLAPERARHPDDVLQANLPFEGQAVPVVVVVLQPRERRRHQGTTARPRRRFFLDRRSTGVIADGKRFGQNWGVCAND